MLLRPFANDIQTEGLRWPRSRRIRLLLKKVEQTLDQNERSFGGQVITVAGCPIDEDAALICPFSSLAWDFLVRCETPYLLAGRNIQARLASATAIHRVLKYRWRCCLLLNLSGFENPRCALQSGVV